MKSPDQGKPGTPDRNLVTPECQPDSESVSTASAEPTEAALSTAEIIAKFSTYGFSHGDAVALQKAASAEGRALGVRSESDGTFSLFDVEAFVAWDRRRSGAGPVGRVAGDGPAEGAPR